MSTLAHAKQLAQRGLPVFRLRRGTKNVFLDSDWATGGATADLATVYDKFSGTECNIGVNASRFVILDVDRHGKVDGFDSLKTFSLPSTFAVETANNGLHLYFDAGGERYGQHDLAPGINVRATNGYVVGPGSVVNGRVYRVTNDAPIAPLPPWLADTLRRASDKAPDVGRIIGELDTPAAIKAAKSYLVNAPLAIEGQGGNNTTYKVCNQILDRGVSPEVGAELLLSEWNSRCVPPWDEAELNQIMANAAGYRQVPIGRDNPREGFVPVKLPTPAQPKLIRFPSEISRESFRSQEANAIVKGLIRPGDLAMIYGESGSGKTFVCLDLCWHVARGVPWRGRKVKRCPVLYISLEGQGGFEMRVEAHKEHFGDTGTHFADLIVPVALSRDQLGEQGVATVVNAYRELTKHSGCGGGLIVIDTLARAMAGDDENTVKDTMLFIERRIASIKEQTGAAVLIVHHTNKLGDIRGSSALKAALDCMMKVERKDHGRTVVLEKIKDSSESEGPLFGFTLRQVLLAKDDDGDDVTSCVLVADNAAEKASLVAPERPTKSEERFLYAFEKCKTQHMFPNGATLPASPVEELKRTFYGLKSEGKVYNGRVKQFSRLPKVPLGRFCIETSGGTQFYVERTSSQTRKREGFEAIEMPNGQGSSQLNDTGDAGDAGDVG